MKDKWIEPFQDKLGDYELDLPAAAPARRWTGWIMPLLTGAAAALLLMLLVRKPETERTLREPLIAALPATLATETPSYLAAARPLPDRPARRLPAANVSHPGPVSSLAKPAVPATPSVPDAAEPEIQPEVQPEMQPEGPAAPAAASPVWVDEPESGRQPRLSARIHFSPLSLRNGTTTDAAPVLDAVSTRKGSPTGQTTDYALLGNLMDNKRNPVSSLPVNLLCDLPVKTGIAIQFENGSRLSWESGLDYSFHRIRVSGQNQTFPAQSQEYRLHYAGIPLKGILTLADWKRGSLYAAAGGEAEWLIAGRLLTRADGQTVASGRVETHPVFFSLTGAAGAEYAFSPRLGLYLEPGFAWHISPSDKLPNYYREHPFSFDLHVGLRLRMGQD